MAAATSGAQRMSSRSLSTGRRMPWSDSGRVGQDVLVSWTERGGFDDVDVDLEDLLEVQDEAGQVDQGAGRLEVDQEVDVAALMLVTAGDGAEYADIRGTAASSGGDDVAPPLPEKLPYRCGCHALPQPAFRRADLSERTEGDDGRQGCAAEPWTSTWRQVQWLWRQAGQRARSTMSKLACRVPRWRVTRATVPGSSAPPR